MVIGVQWCSSLSRVEVATVGSPQISPQLLLGGGAKFGPDGSSIIGSLSGNPEQLFFIVDSRQRTECRMRTNRVVGFYPMSSRNNSLLIAVGASATDKRFTLDGTPD